VQRDPCVPPDSGESPRFLADAMLGRLATWLRLLGYDAAYSREPDRLLLDRSRREARILLTRDTGLLRRSALPPHLFITSDHVMEQLRQVIREVPLDPAARPARRCARCNVAIEPRARAEVAGLVPEFVWSSQEAFWACPSCRRIYWSGTHRRRMDDVIRTLAAG
jgi:uncharacterized protein